MTAPTNIRWLRAKDGPWHAQRSTGGVLCSRKGAYIDEATDADPRALRIAGRPVCGNCRSLLDRQSSTLNETDEGPAPGPEGSTMTTATKPRQKAKSRELIDPKSYGKATDKRLAEERLTINNRLSGLGTQLAREPGRDRKRELKARQTDLSDRRDAINAELRRRAERVSAGEGDAKLAAATRTAGKDLDKAASRTTRGRRRGRR